MSEVRSTSPCLDPRACPPELLRQIYKRYQKLSAEHLDDQEDLLDLCAASESGRASRLSPPMTVSAERVRASCDGFLRGYAANALAASLSKISRYEIGGLAGLQIIPSLLSPDIQKCVLSRLLHRDLSDPRHSTNLHAHYEIKYPRQTSDQARSPSFFHNKPSDTSFCIPRDLSAHGLLSTSQFLGRKLRWMTLGGQYDWSKKMYPSEVPPPFPSDVGDFLQSLFPETTPQAAIVNLYSPGDTLSLHRDVSEASSRGLISVSLGCDAIFVVGLEGDAEGALGGQLRENQNPSIQYVILRLRSGDAVYMSGSARFAWHGVPKIVAGSCPEWMKDWPAGPIKPDGGKDEFEMWRGWMAGKRVNLNVRQMYD